MKSGKQTPSGAIFLAPCSLNLACVRVVFFFLHAASTPSLPFFAVWTGLAVLAPRVRRAELARHNPPVALSALCRSRPYSPARVSLFLATSGGGQQLGRRPPHGARQVPANAPRHPAPAAGARGLRAGAQGRAKGIDRGQAVGGSVATGLGGL